MSRSNGSSDETPSAVRIRPATPDDAPELVALIGGLARYEHLERELVVREKDLQRFLFGPERVAEAVICEVGAEVAGMGVFFHGFSTFRGRPTLYVEDLYVRPEFRRRGVGQAAFRYLAQLALKRNCVRMEWAVLDWNAPAHEFYRSLGAEPLAEWRTWRLSGKALAVAAFGSEEPWAGPPAILGES